MNNTDYFRAKRYPLNDQKSEDFIYTEDLLGLIDNEELRELIINKYNLDKNYQIEIEKVEFLYNLIRLYSRRFKLIRLEAKESDVSSELKFDSESQKPVYIFTIKNGVENEGESEIVYDSLEAEAIYDSINLFYNDKSLSQYVKSLGKKPNKKRLLNDLNNSWSAYYSNNKDSAKTKLFRILSHGDDYYLKSINSSSYKEYGIAESFVMALLELNKFKTSNPETEFFISSVSISESKLDLIISQKKAIKLGDIGFLRSSISIRNEDQGNTSFGVYNALEFFPSSSSTKKIYLFPNQDENKIKNSVVSKHTVSSEKFFETFSSVSELFNLGEVMKNDFHFYNGSKDYDELRSKIEHKLVTNNSPFKNVTKLKDLFSREKTGHIENLETLLRICAESDSIEMEYDLKFRLRYLISNVLLYNSNKY
ncbi:hypothetical protein FNO01nite_29560 [Flavobacterium noncentrifugens]|uniref:Uncharacterized protein n=1 Tax=Flavobacterium noncentrifugens TaxID=1128970 RepID=A0A1G8Y4C4_9FLAO|nr:hypothetical protein [Flavobacterium noncentrifugens]GEP52284.1 hypothetical protein FNO01nite_29560 [Flavobacterium noncentrifugens]SDJ96985.1 hypothetical protein SAMN04487935_2165 [Flavobacterium noncentrifugens]